MRPSRHLIALVLTLTAATVFVVLWVQDAIWFLAGAWGLLAVTAIADLFLSVPPSRVAADVTVQEQGFVSGSAGLSADIHARRGRLPKSMKAALDVAGPLKAEAFTRPALDTERRQAATFASLHLSRRGRHAIRALWLRWSSLLGLFDIIASIRLDREIAVLPDVSPILSGAIRTQMLPLESGQKDMRLRGEGSEFHQLREFTPGMDPRSIDWKRSARMRDLVVRETRAERNHQVILCIDSGRLMAEQLAGAPKLDRAINAALAMCWASGLAGDLVGLYSFDSRPRLFLPASPGRAAFPRLQAACAGLRYETQETNHTLGLTHLSGRLKRRSLVVVFSDFVDSITAELMVENIQVLARHHLIVYVALRDPALLALTEPGELTLDAIARSVSARQILHERRAVLEKLSRLGVLCLDSTPEALTTDLVARYIEIKSRELI